MKKLKLLLFLLCFIAFSISGFSQVSIKYVYSGATSTYAEISGGTVHVTGTFDDVNYTSIPIGFTFTYNSIAYTTLGINSNGFIWFGTTNPATNLYTPISSSTAMAGVIAPYGRDLNNVDANSTIRSELTGTSPNQVFVIQWKGARRYNITGENFNFQIRLYETSNKIEIVYGTCVGGSSTSYPQVGLRGASNTDYLNRTTASNWSATSAGGANNSTCLVSTTVAPASGTTFTFTPATCLAPSALTATSITPTSATLDWTSNGSEPAWRIEYGPTGFTQGTGTKVYTTTKPYLLNGLTSATSYQYYVKALCSASDSSGNAGPYTFVTLCNPITSLPWTEGFEGLSVVGANILPICWAYTNISSNNYSCNGTCNSNTAHTGTKFIGGTWNFDVWDFTPGFQLTAGTSYDFSYWFKCTDATVGYNVSLLYGSTQDVAGMTNTLNAETDLNINVWTLRKFTFTPASTGTYYFGLHNVCPSYSPNGIAFDDFKLELTPSCNAPTALTATAITNNSATLGWTASGSEPTWHIEYGATGFTPGTGTKVYTNTNPKTINGLTASTAYQFYVKAICSANDSSTYAGPFSFTTLCDNVTVFPFTESFDGTTFAPICWGNNKTAGTGDLWQRSTAGTYPTCSPHSGAGMAYFNSYVAAGTRVELVTPALNIPNDNYRVSFWMYRDGGYASNADSVAVYFSTTNSTVGATKILRINRSLSLTPVESVAGWYKYTVNLPVGSGGIGRYIIFEGVSAAGNNIFVDDVTVEAIPSCNAPTVLTATNIAATSALLGWTAGGSESAWRIEYGPAGFTPGTGTKVYTATNPQTISGLTQNTSYDFYVKALCSALDSSANGGPKNFITPYSCPAPTIPVATNIAATSADLGWTVNGSETTWQIEIGTSPMTLGAGFKVVTTNNPTVVPNGTFAPNTLYDFRVRAICAPGDTSLWTSVTTFRTLCNSVSVFPITESFDGTTFAPDCWANVQVSGTGKWARSTAGTYPICTPHTGAGMAFFNSYSFSLTTSANLITVPFDLPSDLYRVSFWMYRDAGYASNYDSITVYYNTMPDLTGATRLLNINRNKGLAPAETGADGWYKYTANMPAGSTGNGRYIIFKATSRYGNNMFIDDVTIEAIPSCNAPTLLTVTNITTTSAQLGWTTGGATLWNLEYGPQGFTPGTGTIIHNVSNPYTLNGLVAGTVYDFYVQDSCSVSDLSSWAGPRTFTTECLVQNTYPWIETFEGTVFPPLCWSIASQNLGATWLSTTYTSHSPTHCAAVPYEYNQDENLITPAFNFATLSHPIFEFWYRTSLYDPTSFNITLWVSTDGGTNWTAQLWDKNSDIVTSGVWVSRKFDLTAYAGQTNMKFKFEYVGNDGDAFFLDDVKISEGSDLAVTFPKNTYQACNLTSTETVQMHIKNVGAKQINTGEKIYTYYKVDALPLVKDSVILSSNLVPNDSIIFNFGTTVDFSAYQQYNYITYISYNDDIRYANDTTKGIVENINFSYNRWATDTIHVTSFPYVLKAGYGYDCYAWNNGGCVIADSIHNINASGWQKVRVIKYGSCEGVDSVYINLVTGIEDKYGFGNLAIFPNPTTGKITLTISGINEKVNLSVVTIQGQEIYTDEFYTMYSGTSRQIDLSAYPKGIYFIKIANDKSVNVKKVVVD
jgi:hypothetical protein